MDTVFEHSVATIKLKGKPWLKDGHLIAVWTAESQDCLQHAMQQLSLELAPYMKPCCTHIKGNGGVKGAARWLYQHLGQFQFVARFDIASYYQSMGHDILLNHLKEINVSRIIQEIVKNYLAVPDIKSTGKGMTAGGSLSPLLGALYLLPLDYAMQRNREKTGILYVRYMDDILILAKKRWHLRTAIQTMYSVLAELDLTVHQQEKRFVGRVEQGFAFLGYSFYPTRKLRPSAESLRRLAVHASRLYEQKEDFARLWLYVTRWFNWLKGGLNGLVSLAGGVRHYWIYVMKAIGEWDINKGIRNN